MSKNIVTDSIEIRSLEDKTNPRYIVKGTAAIANKKHTYEFIKKPDGTFKTLKEMFTPHCIESIKEQSKKKNVFVDVQHELARNASMKALVKDKLSPEQQKQFNNMLKRNDLPIAKFNDITIIGDKLDIETELNPVYRSVDSDHEVYFDAVWYSLQNQFLNGISINFGDFTYATDEFGDTVIDDVDVLGYSFVSGAADPDHSIYEVMIRSLEEGINIRTGEMKMDEQEKAKFAEEKAQLEVEKKKFAEEKLAMEKAKQEADKQVEIDKQAEEQRKIQIELDAKTEELKKIQEEKVRVEAELNTAKGVVKQSIPTNQPSTLTGQNEQFYKEKIKEITAKHDETINTIKQGKMPSVDNSLSGLGELVNLQAQVKNPTADLDPKDAEYIRENNLLGRDGSDIVPRKQ